MKNNLIGFLVKLWKGEESRRRGTGSRGISLRKTQECEKARG